MFVISLATVFACGCQTGTNFGQKEEKVYRKANLEIFLPGKNHLEIVEILGQPHSYSEDAAGRVITWEYSLEVLDQATGLTFYLSRVRLTLEKGVCVDVQVELR